MSNKPAPLLNWQTSSGSGGYDASSRKWIPVPVAPTYLVYPSGMVESESEGAAQIAVPQKEPGLVGSAWNWFKEHFVPWGRDTASSALVPPFASALDALPDVTKATWIKRIEQRAIEVEDELRRPQETKWAWKEVEAAKEGTLSEFYRTNPVLSKNSSGKKTVVVYGIINPWVPLSHPTGIDGKARGGTAMPESS